MKYITKEVRIGIAGIIALCVLVYGINWLKGIHMFQPSSYFYAKFQNVNRCLRTVYAWVLYVTSIMITRIPEM